MGTRSAYVTKPREQITALLRAEPRFFSAGEIHRRLEDGASKVSLSTVYRTLEHLLERGEIAARVDESGESTYTMCAPERHHHHAICRVCGRVEDVTCSTMDQLAESLRAVHGFELDDHKMEFIGRCRACR